MEILSLIVGMFETNCYLVFDPVKSEGVIIDPGDEADRILKELNRLEFDPKMILLTHGHADHIGAVTEIQDNFKIPLYAGRGEESLLRSAAENFSSMVGNPVVISSPEKLLGDGDEITFGSVSLSVIQTPGHSPGGICFYTDGYVFCGDTLFYGSVGRTDFPGCSHEQLLESITNKLLVLPDDTVCFPGHGPSTSIGDEKRHNPFLKGGYFV